MNYTNCPFCKELFYDMEVDFCDACGFPEPFTGDELHDVSDYDYEDAMLINSLDEDFDDFDCITDPWPEDFDEYSDTVGFNICVMCDGDLSPLGHCSECDKAK